MYWYVYATVLQLLLTKVGIKITLLSVHHLLYLSLSIYTFFYTLNMNLMSYESIPIVYYYNIYINDLSFETLRNFH